MLPGEIPVTDGLAGRGFCARMNLNGCYPSVPGVGTLICSPRHRTISLPLNTDGPEISME